MSTSEVVVFESIEPGLTAMVKHDDHYMTWYDHGDSYSPWYDHGDSYSPWHDHGDSYSPWYDHGDSYSPWCRILKSSFNNRQRRIESLSSISNLFLNCSTTTPLNACTRSTRRGIGGASTKNL